MNPKASMRLLKHFFFLISPFNFAPVELSIQREGTEKNKEKKPLTQQQQRTCRTLDSTRRYRKKNIEKKHSHNNKKEHDPKSSEADRLS